MLPTNISTSVVEKRQRVVPDTGYIDVKTIPKYLQKFNSTFYKPSLLLAPPKKIN